MKKSKTVICFVFLAAAAAASVYAVCSYNYDLQFYPHKESIICLVFCAAGTVMAASTKNGLVPLIICTAAGIIASIFAPCCSFLVVPPLLTVFQFRNITGTDKISVFCRKVSFALTAAAYIPFIPTAVKTAELNSGSEIGRNSVFGYIIRALAFSAAAFCLFLFFKSLSVIRIRSAKTVKKKKTEETSVYPESLHTVYLLAAIGALISAVYCCITDDNALVCVSVIAWAGCYAALFISGEPVTAYLQTKAALFFNISDNTEQKGTMK